MKRFIEAIPQCSLLRTHPIVGPVPGWFFRAEETSNAAWVAESKDKWGRLVSSCSVDDQEALASCAEQALGINAQTAQLQPTVQPGARHHKYRIQRPGPNSHNAAEPCGHYLPQDRYRQ